MDLIFTLSEIDMAAQKLLSFVQASGQKVIALHGEMGAGKTTLTGALLRTLGSSDAASSPTFSIINQYALSGEKHMYHMDWYRLRDEAEAINAGVEDTLYSGMLCVVEWPEKAPALLPPDTVHVHLKAVDADTRRLTVQA